MNILELLKSKISTIYVKYLNNEEIENLPIFYIAGSQKLPPPLSSDEEEELLIKLENKDLEARQILVERNLRLVVYIAKKFENTGVGIEDLISFLEKTDFFTAPASTRFHGSFEGGLVEHSLKVYEILDYKAKNNVLKLEIPDDTIKIVSLLHDICKLNFYKVDYRNAKNALGEWEKVPYYTIDDTIPYGHGEKSVMMISEYIKLTPEEKYSIRWHMGYTEPKELYNTIGAAYKKYPLALMMHEADLEATYFYDI